jgi:hypothetical protein
MGASRCCLSGAVLAFALSRAAWADAPARAELTTLLDSGNLLGPEPAAPPPWEALGSLRAGRDNLARFTLETDEVGFAPGLRTGARLGLELRLEGLGDDQPARLRDLSSRFGFSWQAAAGSRLWLAAYPLDSDYLRLGYLHALDWGGTRAARRESVFLDQRGGVPSLLVGLQAARLKLFAGVKWATVEDALAGPRRLWGALGGGSLELASALRADVGFGVFQRQPGFVEGASARLVWRRGASEPELSAEPFRPASLREEPLRLMADAPRGLALALEGVLLVSSQQQRAAPGARRLVSAPAAALYGSARGARLAGHAALGWRSLAFVLRNDARFSVADDVPTAAAAQAELMAWAGGSFTILPLQLVPSFEIGVRLPASLRTPSVQPGIIQSWVVRESGLSPLPTGAGRLPVLAARLGLRWQLSSSLGLMLFVDYQRDPNRARLDADAQRVFDAPDSLNVVAALQARM